MTRRHRVDTTGIVHLVELSAPDYLAPLQCWKQQFNTVEMKQGDDTMRTPDVPITCLWCARLG